MSTTLYWRPDYKDKNELDDTLKYIFAKRFWGQDGSLTSSKVRVNENDIDYLQGLVDAGRKSAKELIEVIRKHGTILVWLE